MQKAVLEPICAAFLFDPLSLRIRLHEFQIFPYTRSVCIGAYPFIERCYEFFPTTGLDKSVLVFGCRQLQLPGFPNDVNTGWYVQDAAILRCRIDDLPQSKQGRLSNLPV